MKIYVDSREAVGKKYNTLVEIHVNGQVVEKGVLQKAEFCCVDLEDSTLESVEMKFFAVNQAETAQHKKIEKCALHEVPNVSNLAEYKDFNEYDPEVSVTIDNADVPRKWIYAYSTQVTKLKAQNNDLICVFNDKVIEGISICEVRNPGLDVSYKRNIDKEETYNAYKEWFFKWIKRELVVLLASIAIFVLAVLLICSFDWSPSSGKSQMALLSLVALILLIAPNGANIYALRENLKIRRILSDTEILDVETSDNDKLNNWKLEYYITPDEYVCFDKRQKLIRDIDLTRWKMIHIGPADKNTYNWKIGFFVEDAEFMSKFLYRLKADDEQLTVRICESWKKSIFRERLLIGEADIGEEISECLGGKGVFIYETENEINKYVHINPGETLDCFFKEEHLEDIVGVISNIATVTDYYKYELGD